MPRLRLRHAALMLPGRPSPFSLAGLLPAAFASAPVAILTNVCLEATEGETIALRGHAQSGRSSLLRLLAGRQAVTAGTCRVEGDVVAILDVEAALDPEATGRENLVRLATTEVDEAVELTQLGELLDVPVRYCSPGMRWRLGFAAAAVQAGDVLLVDECLKRADHAYRPVALARLTRLVDRAPLAVVAEPALFDRCSRAVDLVGGGLLESGRREAA